MAKFIYYIITDENSKPMAWADDQLCYCTDEFWQDEPHPIQAYTLNKCKRLIKKSKQFREYNKFGESKYKLMPFNPSWAIAIKMKQKKKKP